MPSLDWETFNSLPGSKSDNFENLCRGLMRLHYERYGQFKALSNQPGVEFHIKLKNTCPLGDPPRWFGWQCKFHTRTQKGNLRSSSKQDIKESLQITETTLPEITDWILWTPYKLSTSDQNWFYSLPTNMNLHLWSDVEVDDYLSGNGLILRSTYFGELILTPEELAQRHQEAIQPIRERWLEPVHQSIDAERIIRRMLGEPGSWDQMIAVGQRLQKAVHIIKQYGYTQNQLEIMITPFVSACSAFADTLLSFHKILADGDLEIIQQKLCERKILINKQVDATLRKLRTWNLPIALDATNALADMRIAQKLLDEVEEFLGVGLVAVLADAGGGKTQMAAQLTAPQDSRPAGILLHGRDLHKGQTLNDLARQFSINGNPLTSMERLLASLDVAGKWAKCRLPVIIDGLNEAENPKDWRAPLATLRETVKGYPNVLVICTLRTGEHRRDEQTWRSQPQTNARESFAVMALPDDIRKIESEGFGGDVDKAIKKYFNYFKINPGDAEIPAEFMQHPLTLRIFCEVMNPKRESEVKVNYFPASLSPLFEKYVANACERISQMPNLSYSYSVDEVKLAVYKLGLKLWEDKKREVDEASYLSNVSDTARSWDSSIINLLAQEGIVFRNPGPELGKYVITPVYDALGGYIVADSLLEKYANRRIFEWLKEPEVIDSFGGKDSHELASDIFRSLVSLIPHRMDGQQLWKEAPDPFRNAALIFTTELEAKYLDNETIAALLALLKDNPKEESILFSRIQGSRGTPNHPLNAEFLDSALREMSVSERDLGWTEWVRSTRSERFNDLLAIELRWKEDLITRTTSDQLRVKWVMWFLTSTDRELRDAATRALYWFGRGSTVMFFEESLRSLEINDPYVPERMLAASYGVAMAQHVCIGDKTFVNVTLPEFARDLYNSMFAKGAPFSTTHSLMREYATRIIEMISIHNPELFTLEEIQRSKPPFTDGGCREWGESQNAKEKQHDFDSPFHMDFENYTLGSLVQNRRNYEYENEDYQKICAQVLWRVEQLGWSSELFKDIDSSISNEHQWTRPENERTKIDRYGKKYSWIAYFEMEGFLHDQGLLEYWRERTFSVDIDPSFPERVARCHLIKTDFLDSEMDMKEWLPNGPLPNVEPYLRIGEVLEIKGPWIALDGFLEQRDEDCGRSLFCFIRSFFVSNPDVVPFLEHLSHQDLGGRWLPEKPDVVCTFAGEVPWCDAFLKSGLSEFSFVTKEETVKVQRIQPKLYMGGKEFELSQNDLIQLGLFGNTTEETEETEETEQFEVREVLVEVEEVKKEYKKFNTLIPVCDFRGENYQYAFSDIERPIILAKEIASDMDLIGQPQTFDLFTKDGEKATFNISDHSNDIHNRQHMFFMRADLLKTYLMKNNLTLIWAIWGEREYLSTQFKKNFSGSDCPEQPYKVFSFVKCYE